LDPFLHQVLQIHLHMVGSHLVEEDNQEHHRDIAAEDILHLQESVAEVDREEAGNIEAAVVEEGTGTGRRSQPPSSEA